MTRVDFYVLKKHAAGGKHRLACRLADKAFRLGHRIYIQASGPEEAARLDELLWTFGPGSFVPHGLNTPQLGDPDPVLIGDGEPPPGFGEVLICLASEVPAFFSRFERMVELVDDTEADKQLARERFRFYRDRGYPLETHEVKA
jgi:DNA polymerase-3 subunit chi